MVLAGTDPTEESMSTRLKGLGIFLAAMLIAALSAGCGSTDSGNAESDVYVAQDAVGADGQIIPPPPPGTCTHASHCTEAGEECIGAGDGTDTFVCGVVNTEGGALGTLCQSDDECLQNYCYEAICTGPTVPDTDPFIKPPTDGCNWIDSPELCLTWQCYYEDGTTICRHNDIGVPDDGISWTCVDNDGTTVCTATGSVSSDDPSWICNYSSATDTTTCIANAEFPDSNPTWLCEFPEEGDGNTKVCVIEGGSPPAIGCDSGNIEGYVCTPSTEAVSGADVTISYLDCDGNPATTTVQSDVLGYFVVSGIPVGSATMNITKGPYNNTVTVEIVANQTTSFADGDPRTCFDVDGTKIAVVSGAYDSIEGVLDTLGFEYDLYNGLKVMQGWNFLLDPDQVNQYDIIFINCGVHPEYQFASYMSELNTIGTNLRNFVDTGHYIYASDWAFFFIEAAFPDKVDFLGEDLSYADVLAGDNGIHAVTVEDLELQAYTGMSTAMLDLNLPQWAVAQAGGPGTKTYLRGDALLTDGSVLSNVPFLLDWRSGEGSAAYTVYHIHANQAADDFFTFIAMNFK